MDLVYWKAIIENYLNDKKIPLLTQKEMEENEQDIVSFHHVHTFRLPSKDDPYQALGNLSLQIEEVFNGWIVENRVVKHTPYQMELKALSANNVTIHFLVLGLQEDEGKWEAGLARQRSGGGLFSRTEDSDYDEPKFWNF